LKAQAEAREQTLEEYLQEMIEETTLEEADLALSIPPIRNGTDLVAYWQQEGIIGSRPDITDSQEYARALRRKAERRERRVHCATL
jgi:hypothetical protein